MNWRYWLKRNPPPSRGDRHDQLEREVRAHLDLEAEEQREAGLSPQDARSAARRAFGSPAKIQEEVREMWRWSSVEIFLFDVRHALRGLLRDRAFTIVAVLSIALGVGANSSIFSLVDQALFRSLPVHEPERLVLLRWNGNFLGSAWGSDNLNSHPFFRDLKEQNQVFDGVFARHPTGVIFSARSAPEPVNAEIVSGSYFPVLGVRAALGRLIDESDDRTPGAHPVVVISYDYWRTRLGGDPGVVGRKVLVNNHPMTIIGVAAAGFTGVDWSEVPVLWIPAMMKRQATPDFDWLDNRRGRWLHVFGRLKPGVTREQAEAGLQPWFQAMLEADRKREGFPPATEQQLQSYLSSRLEALPAAQGYPLLRRDLETPLYVVLAATALILILACLNVANLCLARAVARRREIALRLALGASRGRIVKNLLLQSAFLAFGGALLGVLLAPAVSHSLISFLPETVDLSPAVNARVFGLALAAALLTGLLFGLAPAIHASRAHPMGALKEESASVAVGIGMRKALVVAQIALALILLIGSGLFARTLANLRGQGPGFSSTNLVSLRIDPQKSGYKAADGQQVMRRLLADLKALPEVENAAISTAGLLKGGSWGGPMTIQDGGRRVTDRTVHRNAVSPEFFDTLGVALLSGRKFTERDAVEFREDRATRDIRSAIVNESFTRRYFGDRSPLGARLAMSTRPDANPTIEIVGVVKTFSYRGLRETDDQAFYPYYEASFSGGGFYVRTRLESEAAFDTLRRVVRQADPNLAIVELRTIDDQLDRALMSERLLAMLAGAFATLAVVLVVVGLYGVMSFVVTRRTREIGIRLALGATRGAALWLVLRDAVLMLILGLALALPVIWSVGRLIQSQLYGVQATDSVTIGAAVMLIALVALVASAIPARRAATVNPMEALRYE